MNFKDLPGVNPVTQQSIVDNGFKIAWYDRFDLYLGCEQGDTVYCARVGNRLWFLSTSSSAVGLSYLTYSGWDPTRWTMSSTEYEGVYAVSALNINAISAYTFTINLTNFDSENDMLSMFNDTFVETDTPNGIVVRVVAQEEDSNDAGGTSQPDTEGANPEETGFDDESDEVPPSELPHVAGTDSGLVTLFRPTLQELNQLGAYLWTNLDQFIENLNKLFANPMDYMIALNIFPVVPPVGAQRQIKIGSFSTSISMPPLTSQWYEWSGGLINIPEYWGAYLDYAPYTKIHAMLPFIGSVTLNTDEVMNQMLGLRYRIDMLSGTCVAMITIDNDVYYQYTGECALAIPMTGADWSRVYSAAIGAVGTAITGTMSGVIAGHQVQAAQRMNRVTTTNAARNAVQRATDNQIASWLNAGGGLVSQVMGAKAHIQHSGTVSGGAAILGQRKPYIMIEYPNQSLPENYRHYVGYPSNISSTLGSLSGYTECEQVIVSGLTEATESEITEVIELLKGGVYL